ncbi:MAG: ATP-binding protein [Myxococcales bacterium]|nr:ATP-binding protein [Myxococcales bacterium]
MSKWIGETEESLGRVFDAAETGHVLLLFGEADPLFARRTEDKGATERSANLEVNYLLQRIESFAGIAILTTNLDGSIDDAFRRRLAAHVQFPAPGDEERERLWRALLPAAAPVGADSTRRRWPRASPTLRRPPSATPPWPPVPGRDRGRGDRAAASRARRPRRRAVDGPRAGGIPDVTAGADLDLRGGEVGR